ncbi:helix-turn-helix domain-containing protein [Paraburkholderia sp. LEh10]|jgi:transcriptional regulator GlxA family with amidase domain|uniref:helix-turn-helix domain-containing protein n=1 Tax=Paraburkholderia sp. LEh10 TaxID=2821353 RepID=UPI001AEB76F8|nr:helix-turn-helix domain-containing protein [Paraburkholderia sp. LEh10]MBP0593317.1 helix-turn-helix domain-containing protein [Paraburkholderia sp. LEh10]
MVSTQTPQKPDPNDAEGMDDILRRLRHVALVLFDGFDLLSASVIANTLEIASDLSTRGPIQWSYQIATLAPRDGYIVSSAELRVCAEAFDTYMQHDFDAIFAVVGSDATVDSDAIPLLAWINRARAKTADVRLVGATLSAPEGRAYGTQRSPDQDREHGPDCTAHTNPAGPCADCKTRMQSLNDALTGALKLIRRDMGDSIARRVADRLSICSHDMLNAIFEDVVGSTPAEKVRAAAHWLQDNCRRQVTIEDAAQVAAMSERSLLRHFRSELGMTPSDYLMHARLQVVCSLLAETDLPVDKVAKRAGMTSGDHLARSFRRHMKTSPSEYRAQHRLHC